MVKLVDSTFVIFLFRITVAAIEKSHPPSILQPPLCGRWPKRRIDGKPLPRMFYFMKTTIDIPDALYKKAKIRAVETGSADPAIF